MIHTKEDFIYNGIFHNFFWNVQYNRNATIENGLANCTTMAYGLSIMESIGSIDAGKPVSSIVSASNWHKVLTNGWSFIKYDKNKLHVGDIIEWVDGCHVAKVIGKRNKEFIVGSSFYTGEHGVAYYNGTYDTRNFKSLQDLSNFMVTKYPFRFYHECTVDEEIEHIGKAPTYILIKPDVVLPVKENKEVDQIHVLTDEQNIRNSENKIVGTAQHGYYNVIGQKISNGYVWYEVQNNRYIAGVEGRVVYIPSTDSKSYKEKYEELLVVNKELTRKLDEINKLSAR